MIGIDTVQISRMEKALENAAFKTRVFLPDEIIYCESKRNGAASFAGLFCAKEAAVKALGTGFGHGIMPTDIEISHTPLGAPTLGFRGNAVTAFYGYTAHLSISHDGDCAVAAVYLTKGTN